MMLEMREKGGRNAQEEREARCCQRVNDCPVQLASKHMAVGLNNGEEAILEIC